MLGTLAAGGLAFLAASRTWAHVRVATDGLPSDSVDVSGADAEPIVSALALVVVTASLAILAASPRVRRVVGGFTVLVALVGAGVVVLGRSALDSAVDTAVEESPAWTGSGGHDFTPSAWMYVTVVAFVLAAVLGAITAWFGATWPTMGSRYDAPAARSAVEEPQTDADMWKALDEGHDPTQ